VLSPTRRSGRFIRYAVGSAFATGVSAVTFALAYRMLHAGPQLASVAAFSAGAVVNFVSNRFWAWSRRHRLGGQALAESRSDKLRGLGRDLAGYLTLAVATALAAAGVTTLTERLTRTWVLVEASYFGTYAAMFLVKFVLLDRVVFRSRHQVAKTTRV
jgi:putative flippase GtrA